MLTFWDRCYLLGLETVMSKSAKEGEILDFDLAAEFAKDFADSAYKTRKKSKHSASPPKIPLLTGVPVSENDDE